MTFETWIAFGIASAAVVLIPGPNIILSINYALKHGRSSAWANVSGVMAGAFVAMTASLAGAGAVLAASATLFNLLKLAGAAYLIWMAYQLWTSPPTAPQAPATTAQTSIFMQSFLTSMLNPKGPIFYVAFVPQFVNTNLPVWPQFAILIATFLCVAGLNSIMWLFGAANLRQHLLNPAKMRIVQRVGAAFLFVAGLFTASASQAHSR